MDKILLAAYAIGFLYTARRVAIAALEDLARTNKRMRAWRRPEPGERLVDTEDRLMALLFGASIAIVWPAALVVTFLAKGLRVPTEVACEKDRELEQLRVLAREHDLPMPSQERV